MHLLSQPLLQPEIYQRFHPHTALLGLFFQGRKQLHLNRHRTTDFKRHIGGGRVVEIGKIVGVPVLANLIVGVRL